MKIHEGFAEIADRFDVLLVDAYGVFWDGGRFFPGSLEVMEEAVKERASGLAFCQIPLRSAPISVRYEKKGMFAGRRLYRFCHFRQTFSGKLCWRKNWTSPAKTYISGVRRGLLCLRTALIALCLMPMRPMPLYFHSSADDGRKGSVSRLCPGHFTFLA